MQCPICHKLVQFTDPCMPFCSERCKLLDLGAWASEKYVISEPVRLDDIQHDDVLGHDIESDDLE
jgi:uncharacterized protein